MDRWDKYPLDGAPSTGQSAFKIWNGTAPLPNHVDLRGDFGPVTDVGPELRAASAFAFTAVAEFIIRRTPRRGVFRRLSPLYLYYYGRSIEQSENKPDAGLSLVHANAALQAYGGCPEVLWPWDAKKYREKPPQACRDTAIEFVTVNLVDPWTGEDGVMRCLADGNPVVFRYVGPQDLLRQAGATGRIPQPPASMRIDLDAPGHPMVVVGYYLRERALIVRNCWGADWGMEGHVIMPLDLYNLASPNAVALGPMPSETDTWQKEHGLPGDVTPSSIEPAASTQPAGPDATELRTTIRKELQSDMDDALKSIKDRFKKN